MKLDLNNLPKDTELLHRLVKELAGDLATKQEEIDKQSQENQQLQKRLDELLRYRYGKRSQKIDPNQLTLWQQTLDEDIAETKQAIGYQESEKDDPSKGQAKRQPIPEHIPRDEIVYKRQDVHGDCGHPLHAIGDQTSEELHWIPGRFYVKRHIQTKYACRQCETVVTADKPARPIEKGVLGSSFIAQMLLSKYQDHLPLERLQHKIEREQNYRIPVSTLSDAVGRSGALLMPLLERLAAYVRARNHVHTDDTPVNVLDPGNGKTKTGRIWVYLHTGTDGPPAAVFDYTPTRSKKGPIAFLTGFQGCLQADGYTGYDDLYAGSDVLEVACWAHVRSKFEKIEKRTQSPIAQKLLAFIAKLYQLEKTIKDLDAESRQDQRQQHAIPMLQTIHQALSENLMLVSTNSDTAVAIRYALHRWQALMRYTTDGRLNIDNNPAERSLRTVAVGRKNWLFFGSDLAGQRAAVIYSLIQTCVLNQINPYDYLHDVLDRIAEHPNNRLDQLLPYNWEPISSGN